MDWVGLREVLVCVCVAFGGGRRRAMRRSGWPRPIASWTSTSVSISHPSPASAFSSNSPPPPSQPPIHPPANQPGRQQKKTVAVVNGPRSIGLKGNRNRHGTSWLAECRFQSVADYTTENSAHEPQSKPRHKHRRRADNKQRNDGRMVPRLSADGFHCLSR